MKWFKHYSNAHTNKLVDALLRRKNGHEYYAMYWLLLEALCEEFKRDTTVFEISSDVLCGKLRVKYDRKLNRFLKDLVEISESFDKDLVKFSESFSKVCSKIYTIETPIILELMGKDFKRARQSSVSDTPKKKEIRNKKKEKEKENEETLRKRSVSPKEKLFTISNDQIDIVYEKYPRKEGKAKGYQKLKAQIKSIDQYEKLKTAVNNYSRLTASENKKYIKHFSTWVSVWTDYIEIEDTTEEKLTKAISEQEEQVEKQARDYMRARGMI